MRLDNFDLNLLIAFDVLLEEQSVTRAAERMNMTQSAMSAALSRLRLALNDELLIQHGRKMLATPHARALAPQVAETILRLRSLISSAAAFEPTSSERRFEIAGSDYICTVLIAPLLPRLKRLAPNIELSIALPSTASVGLLNDGKLDLMLMPEQFASSEHPKKLLFEERHVVVGWSENPVFRYELTEESFYSCGHVGVKLNGTDAFIETHMQRDRDRRRIAALAPSFALVPWLLPGTLHLALMHERMAKVFAQLLPLKIVDPPFDLPVMREIIQYHIARSSDQGLQWLMNEIVDAAHQTSGRLGLGLPSTEIG